MIMCNIRASGIAGEVDDSYLVRVEPGPSGGAHVLWTDLPTEAMVFDDAAAAAEFCRDSPLELFVVSFVPVPGQPSPAPSLPRPRSSPRPTSSSGCTGWSLRARRSVRRSPRPRPTSCAPWA